MGDIYLDSVVSFSQPPGSSNDGGLPVDALGAPDAVNFVSIDIPEILILRFSDNFVFDGPGADLRLYESSNGDSLVDVIGSWDGISYEFLVQTNGNADIDLATTSLSALRFLRFDGLEDGGLFQGYDLDAAEALNSMWVENARNQIAAVGSG